MAFFIALNLLFISVFVFMALAPSRFSKWVIDYAESSYFHVVEVFIRMLASLVFLVVNAKYAESSLIEFLGFLFIVVSAFLVLMSPETHKYLKVKSVEVFQPAFRFIGPLLALFFGYVLYLGVAQ